uniref:Uncharacterized protein n=1 Tax=Rhizophora mucronata TaxID=61149 RepID=A0A2P2R3B5_RHIMU
MSSPFPLCLFCWIIPSCSVFRRDLLG